MAASQGAVVAGVVNAHRQQERYLWKCDCAVCCDSSLCNGQHRRLPPRKGVLAVDVAALASAAPHVLVFATQLLRWEYAEPMQG